MPPSRGRRGGVRAKYSSLVPPPLPFHSLHPLFQRGEILAEGCVEFPQRSYVLLQSFRLLGTRFLSEEEEGPVSGTLLRLTA